MSVAAVEPEALPFPGTYAGAPTAVVWGLDGTCSASACECTRNAEPCFFVKRSGSKIAASRT